MKIETEEEYDDVCEQIYILMQKENLTKEDEIKLESLVEVEQAYSAIHYPISEPSKEDMEQFRKEQEL